MTLASSFPGEIKPIQLDGSMEYIAQKSAFLCATPGVELSTHITRAGAGFFGGEGLFLSVVEGPGRVWLQTVSASEFAKRLMPFMPSKG
jgi:uncharacterized protein (AIM24 family)